MILTIFTPSYNRSYILPELYKSLCRQTCKNFEWLIVDDGSTDGTEKIVEEWLNEAAFVIRYIKQTNGGKHRAINRGVREAKGELFFIVDSDDYLSDNAVERVLFHYNAIKINDNIGGVCGARAFPNGQRIGGNLDFNTLDISPLDFRIKLHIKGDMAEVVKTEVLRKYPFPSIDGEYFCPEALIWDRISDKYRFRYFNENIYMCEYLGDGLTASMTRIRMKSPQYSMLYYLERFHRKIGLRERIKAAINYWRFRCCYNNNVDNSNSIRGWGILLFPIGLLFHINDLRVK